jgi:hypothetical protein
MPFKFWKKEQPREKGGAKEPAPKAEAPEKKVKAGEGPKAAEKAEVVEAAPKPAAAAEEAPSPEVVEGVIHEAHAALVELGLTIPATMGVFTKRVDAYPGGAAAFAKAFRATPYRATTKLLADWLGFHALSDFDPEAFLKDVNLRLSSFKLAVKMTDVNWLDQELSLRKARIQFDGQEKVVRFKDARDLLKGINEFLTSRKLVFIELETWSDEFAFMLVREPKWEKLAATELVVVKAHETAVGGECGECGAAVGPNWHDCLACGAVFGSE